MFAFLISMLTFFVKFNLVFFFNSRVDYFVLVLFRLCLFRTTLRGDMLRIMCDSCEFYG